MNEKPKDEYVALFQGVKLSKREANKVGFALILGFIGAAISAYLFGPQNKLISLTICSVLVGIGYFWIGNKIFKK